MFLFVIIDADKKKSPFAIDLPKRLGRDTQMYLLDVDFHSDFDFCYL